MVAFKNKILVKVLKIRMILQCTVVNELKKNIYMHVQAVKSQITCNIYEINTDIYINYWHIHIYMFSFGKLHFNDNFLSSNINQEADHSLSNKALHTNKMLNRKTLLLIVY